MSQNSGGGGRAGPANFQIRFVKPSGSWYRANHGCPLHCLCGHALDPGVYQLPKATAAVLTVVSRALGVTSGSPCLLVERRTWRGTETVTIARQVFRGDSFDLIARFGPESSKATGG